MTNTTTGTCLMTTLTKSRYVWWTMVDKSQNIRSSCISACVPIHFQNANALLVFQALRDELIATKDKDERQVSHYHIVANVLVCDTCGIQQRHSSFCFADSHSTMNGCRQFVPRSRTFTVCTNTNVAFTTATRGTQMQTPKKKLQMRYVYSPRQSWSRKPRRNRKWSCNSTIQNALICTQVLIDLRQQMQSAQTREERRALKTKVRDRIHELHYG